MRKRIECISEVREIAFPDTWYKLASGDHFWFRWRFAAFLNQLRELRLPLVEERQLLEIGCGTGVLSSQLEAHSKWRVDGADLNMAALAQHVETRGRLFYYDVLDQQEGLRERYDGLLMFDILEHVEEPTNFLSAALHHLKPGGHVFINVPALPALFSNYDRAAGHLRRYDKALLDRDWQGLGASLLDLRYWGLSLVPVVTLRKLLVARLHSGSEVIRRGFSPRSKTLNDIACQLMHLETVLLRRPPLGTSLLATLQKQVFRRAVGI